MEAYFQLFGESVWILGVSMLKLLTILQIFGERFFQGCVNL